MSTPEGTKKKKSEQTAEAVPVQTTPAPRKLTRSKTDRVIAGVCGGLGEYLAIDPVIIRLLFVILIISGGSGFLLYLILWIVLPEKGNEGKSTQDVVKENSKDLEHTIEDAAKNVEAIATRKNTQTWVGIGIIIIGVMLMANNFGYVAFSDIVRVFFRTLWPIAVIALGLVILIRNKDGK